MAFFQYMYLICGGRKKRGGMTSYFPKFMIFFPSLTIKNHNFRKINLKNTNEKVSLGAKWTYRLLCPTICSSDMTVSSLSAYHSSENLFSFRLKVAKIFSIISETFYHNFPLEVHVKARVLLWTYSVYVDKLIIVHWTKHCLFFSIIHILCIIVLHL